MKWVIKRDGGIVWNKYATKESALPILKAMRTTYPDEKFTLYEVQVTKVEKQLDI